ncbi:MAG: aminopeptidase [Patescibacteria group bacterium]|jgi:aminopeptidase
MIDPRTKKLAQLVVRYFLKVKHDSNVVISGSTEAAAFVEALYIEVLKAGAHPVLRLSLPGLGPLFYKYAKDHHLKKFPEILDYTAKNAQYYIGIVTDSNTKEMTSVDPSKMMIRESVTHPITNYICNERGKIRRASVGYPCQALAQEAEMSIHEYEDFVFGAEIQDWDKVKKNINKVSGKFRAGKHVHLLGKNVDLEFDIHGDKVANDMEGDNIPCGEIFMAPVRESAKGWIKFDFPAIEAGKEVPDIYLEFNQGKVIKSDCSKNKNFLKEQLKTDSNSSYLGEFGIGLNPKIKKFTRNLLFDEKIIGTIHLALGMAYKENGGGNDSAIHWDIVKDMKRGKIILDGKVIQENGAWKI